LKRICIVIFFNNVRDGRDDVGHGGDRGADHDDVRDDGHGARDDDGVAVVAVGDVDSDLSAASAKVHIHKGDVLGDVHGGGDGDPC
jgi:hypothetical protein